MLYSSSLLQLVMVSNYDDYFPGELNNMVGKTLLFRFQYSDYNINNNHHVYQVQKISEDQTMIELFKKDFLEQGAGCDVETPLLKSGSSSKFSSSDVVPFNIEETPKSKGVAASEGSIFNRHVCSNERWGKPAGNGSDMGVAMMPKSNKKNGDGDGDDVEQNKLVAFDFLLYPDFRHEVNLLVKLRHPYIVQFLGAVTEKKPLMLITEYPRGGDLNQCLKEKGALSPATIVNFALDIASTKPLTHGLPRWQSVCSLNDPTVKIEEPMIARNEGCGSRGASN
ncbi:integrin-linked protein kinase 1-like protein [Tanacetum coccineum]